jgi:hypothetical protein
VARRGGSAAGAGGGGADAFAVAVLVLLLPGAGAGGAATFGGAFVLPFARVVAVVRRGLRGLHRAGRALGNPRHPLKVQDQAQRGRARIAAEVAAAVAGDVRDEVNTLRLEDLQGREGTAVRG